SSAARPRTCASSARRRSRCSSCASPPGRSPAAPRRPVQSVRTLARSSGQRKVNTVTNGLEFGLRLATFSEDGTPAATRSGQVWAMLGLLEGHFASIWVQDHLIPEHPSTRPEWDCFEAWSTLTHLAAKFPAFQFGTVVLASSYRSPALLAKMA